MKISGGQWGAILAIAVAGAYSRGAFNRPFEWGDALMFALLGLLLLWLLGGRKNAAHHESLNQGIAFRLGKSLNRIRRRKSV